MRDITPDICDKYGSKVKVLDLPLHNFGLKSVFWGAVVTVRCYHDTSKVKEIVSQNGKGKVLFVDGDGSMQRALFGKHLAFTAAENEWEGVIIYGAVRDVAWLADFELGVKALGACPVRTERRDNGQANVALSIINYTIQPGDYIYSDWNGIVMSDQKLDVC